MDFADDDTGYGKSKTPKVAKVSLRMQSMHIRFKTWSDGLETEWSLITKKKPTRTLITFLTHYLRCYDVACEYK